MTRRYEIEEMLSQDDRGVAFRARDREENRDVVLRRFFPNGREGGGLQAAEQEAFQQAVEKLKALKLKELRKTLDGGCDPVDGIPFLVTDWVEGDTLGSFTRGKPLESASVKDIVEVALKASQELSQVLGHETLWVGCGEDSIVIPESGRGVTFWVSPLASLNFRGLLPLAELAERLLGWKDKPIQHDSTGNGLAGWIRQIRGNPKGWTLSQALEALNRSVPSASPASATPVAPTQRPPVAATKSSATATKPGATATKPGATATKQGASATKPGAPPAKPVGKSSPMVPLLITSAAVLVIGGGGFAIWKSGAVDKIMAKFSGSTPVKRPPTMEEMRRDLAAKTMPTTPSATGVNAESAPKPAASPAAPAVTANSLSGTVISARQGTSDTVFYLELLADGAGTRWVGYDNTLKAPGMTPDFLSGFKGKKIQATGEFKKDKGNKGDVLHVRKREDIKVL